MKYLHSKRVGLVYWTLFSRYPISISVGLSASLNEVLSQSQDK